MPGKKSATISLHNLTKRYGRTSPLALNKISLNVQPGEVYGFLGANGAGKTTTIRTLLNFIQPTGGTASILGYDVMRQSVEVRRHVGYLAGEVALYTRMTGEQFLEYMAELQPPKHKDRLNHLAKRFEADLKKPLETLSKGNRQKIGLIQAFMHEPEVLILDEPTSGLDPLMQEEFFELVQEASAAGTSVFVSSHNFSEVQRMCARVGFIRQGKLIAEQTLADLADKAAHTFKLTFRDRAPVKELSALKLATVTTRDEHHVSVSIRGELTPLFALLAKHHVTRMEQQEVNLEQEFLHYYRDQPVAQGRPA